MLVFKLAYRNLIGAGLRTWLNVIVLSFSFVAIIWTQGLYLGMGEEAAHAMIDYQVGGGQYWARSFDPFDPLTFEESHQRIPEALLSMIDRGEATPILIVPGSIYPDGRMMPVLLKGIAPDQQVLKIPTRVLNRQGEELPGLIGERMAKRTGLKVGNFVTIRWRDANGTFDATDVQIVSIMKTKVSTIDNGQLWLPLRQLWEMTSMENQATKIVVAPGLTNLSEIPSWQFKSQFELLKDIRDLVKSKSTSASILYAVLLALAMIAIFDTQVLSIFRRRKEIGTLMALGMTRLKVILLFTVEGAFHGILAAVTAAVYGIPLLIYFSTHGYPLPEYSDSFGMGLGSKLYPVYSASLILGTTFLVLLAVTVVSYLPTRRIARLKPTDALRGKWS